MHDNISAWNIPQGTVALAEDEVHVWKAVLDVPIDTRTALQQVLSLDETKQAAKFYFEKDRQHWIVAHGILRTLLGAYLKVEPTEIQFVTNAYGKPAIVSPPVGVQLHFNMAHSGNMALYAFSVNREVGVDVEYMRSDVDYVELAQHFFSPHEKAQLSALPTELQEEAFYVCWSRKEAYIKARGKGLSLPLDQFDVSLTPGKPASLLASREDAEATANWSLHALEPGAHYAGALVVEGMGWSLKCLEW